MVKVTPDVRSSLEEKNVPDELDKRLLEHYTGFSKVFKLLTSLKKPIVGHNLLLDLMFMHKQFYRPLPGEWDTKQLRCIIVERLFIINYFPFITEKYETFKKNINQLFPLVYDTKFLSFEMKKILGESKYY